MVAITVNVDGKPQSHDVEPRLLLVHYLRDVVGKVGTPVGCDTSNCGACTVSLDGRSVKSCTVLAVQADGAEVLTVQGLADTVDSDLHPVQEAFIEAGGVQCGFCTPGFIVATHDLLQRKPKPTDAEIREALAGNLCRCTGYEKILDAVHLAAARMSPA